MPAQVGLCCEHDKAVFWAKAPSIPLRVAIIQGKGRNWKNHPSHFLCLFETTAAVPKRIIESLVSWFCPVIPLHDIIAPWCLLWVLWYFHCRAKQLKKKYNRFVTDSGAIQTRVGVLILLFPSLPGFETWPLFFKLTLWKVNRTIIS